jgi:hypothetical protein
MARPVLIVALCILISGCSATVTHKVSTNDETATGIRYYDSAPYLLVYSDGKNGLNWQIIYLADQSHVMTATPQIIGGHTEMTLSFSSGVLSTASTIGDTTALPKALIAAVQTALPLLAAAAAGPAQPGFPAPSLYRLVVSDGVLYFKGMKGDTKIQVPILLGPAS